MLSTLFRLLRTILLFLKEDGRGVAFLQFPQVVLEISAFRTSPMDRNERRIF